MSFFSKSSAAAFKGELRQFANQSQVPADWAVTSGQPAAGVAVGHTRLPCTYAWGSATGSHMHVGTRTGAYRLTADASSFRKIDPVTLNPVTLEAPGVAVTTVTNGGLAAGVDGSGHILVTGFHTTVDTLTTRYFDVDLEVWSFDADLPFSCRAGRMAWAPTIAKMLYIPHFHKESGVWATNADKILLWSAAEGWTSHAVQLPTGFYLGSTTTSTGVVPLLEAGGKIFAFGGGSGDTSGFVIDPETFEIDALPTRPAGDLARGNGSASSFVMSDGAAIYFFGATSAVLDPTSLQWTTFNLWATTAGNPSSGTGVAYFAGGIFMGSPGLYLVSGTSSALYLMSNFIPQSYCYARKL